MGNLVNQFVSANNPKIENLQSLVNQYNGQVIDISTKITSDTALFTKQKADRDKNFKNLKNSISAALQHLAQIGNSNYVSPSDSLIMEYIKGSMAFSTFAQPDWKGYIDGYNNAQKNMKITQERIDGLNTQLIEAKKNLAETQASLISQIDMYNKGLAAVTQQEADIANQASANLVNEAQAKDADIQKIKADQAANLAKIAADQAVSEKTVDATTNASSGNTKIIVVVAAIVIVVGIIAWALIKGGK